MSSCHATCSIILSRAAWSKSPRAAFGVHVSAGADSAVVDVSDGISEIVVVLLLSVSGDDSDGGVSFATGVAILPDSAVGLPVKLYLLPPLSL